jgi:hypothetical protein
MRCRRPVAHTNCHLLAGMAHADAAIRHHDPNALGDESPGLHATNELAHLPKGRSAVDGLEGCRLITFEAQSGTSPVVPDRRSRASTNQDALERRPAGKDMAGPSTNIALQPAIFR